MEKENVTLYTVIGDSNRIVEAIRERFKEMTKEFVCEDETIEKMTCVPSGKVKSIVSSSQTNSLVISLKRSRIASTIRLESPMTVYKVTFAFSIFYFFISEPPDGYSILQKKQIINIRKENAAPFFLSIHHIRNKHQILL